MKKFSFKKLTVLALAATGLASLTGAVGCLGKKTTDLVEPENIEITRLPVPDDGSLPTAHTCAENMAYVVSVFDAQPKYHTYSYGVTAASIATQTTRTFRDYSDGVLMTTDLTYSAMVKSGTQTCTVFNEEGEGEVYFRTSAAPGADTLPSQADWSVEPPTFFNERAYHYTYGLLPTELFNYIVNEQNIIDSEQLKVNSDGTYTQNFVLDPVASTYFYQFGMKTRGGLSSYPEFESISFSVTFDGDWKILSSEMHEVAKVNKGVIVSSISDFSTQYFYGDDHFDDEHFSYYDSYYKNYLGDENLEQGGAIEDKVEMTVVNVLSNGFSQIMNGGAQFEIDLDLGKNAYAGYVFLTLDLADPLQTLGLKLSLGKDVNTQNFYAEYADGEMSAYYGKDFALSANLAEVKLNAGQFEEIIGKISQALAKSVPYTDTANAEAALSESGEGSDPLSALMASMSLDYDEKQAVLTLNTDDLLGTGIGINARLVFGINNNKIFFRGGTVSDITVGGEKLDLRVKIQTTNAQLISHDSVETGANLSDYVADVYNLLNSELLKVNASVDGDGEKVSVSQLKGVNADVTAFVNLYGITVGAEAKASYALGKNKISATVQAWYNYGGEGYGDAMLALTEFNGAPANIKLHCNVEQLSDAIGTLINTAGGFNDEKTDGLVSVINGALSSDFSGLITDMYADKAQIKIGVSVDTVLEMLNLNTGIKFGNCTLKYRRGEEVYGGTLSAELPALGFSLSVSGAEGAIEKPDLSDSLDLVYVIEDVKDLANSKLFKLNLGLNGDGEGVSVSQLKGVGANFNAYLDLNGLAVAADADISYAYKNDKISAKISAYHIKEDSGSGDIALSLKEINGRQLAANVRCNIDETVEGIEALLSLAGVETSPFNGGLGDISGGLATTLDKILGADFSALLPVLSTDNGGLNVAVNLDETLNVFGVESSLNLGNLSLAYRRSTESEAAKLIASAPAVGLNLSLGGCDGEIEVPDLSGYLNLNDLLKVVNGAWKEVNEIIAQKSIAFEIERGETYLSLDGILVEIWGNGEVSWKEGSEYIALDFEFSIAEGNTADVASFKLIYDKNAVDKPIVKLALNEAGIEIYSEDIEGVKNGFNEIYTKIAEVLGGKDANETVDTEEVHSDGEVDGGEEIQPVQPAKKVSYEKLYQLIFGVLASDEWVDTLNDFTLTSNGNSVALKYLSDNAANIEIGTANGLTLHYDGAFGSRFSLSGGLAVTADAGSLTDVIENKFKLCNMSSSKTEGSAPFIRLAYDFLFESISDISVENILGAKTYTVKFRLDGANTNIDELSDVYVGAEIYVTGERGEQGKLAEANLNVDAAGVVLKLNVITERVGNNTRFYINLNQVMDIKLPDLKVLATQDSLYDTIEVLLNAVNDTNLLETIGSLMGGKDSGTTDKSDTQNPEQGDKISQSQIDKIADVLQKVLNFNFSQAVVATEVNGVTTAVIDLDNIVKQLGVNAGALGTVEAVIDHNAHSMKTSGKTLITDVNGNTELKEWISLSSELAARRDYSKLDRTDYISIEFLPTLLDDIIKFATDDNGKIYDKFTLSGAISANIVNLFTVNIDNCAATVELGGKNGLSVSLVAHVNKVSALGLVTIPDSTFGLTYQDGLLTLARGLNTSKPEYKVMTFDYFIDHMLTESNSALQWLLNISGWKTLLSTVKLAAGDLNISSGLTTPEDIYLYKASVVKEEQEISMYDFVDAISVVLNGNPMVDFGNPTALENALGVSDNYYGFALNAGAISGGTLTELYAAITRGNGGISGVKAYGAIQSYVTFSVNLNYQENCGGEYVLGTSFTSGVTAPSLYNNAKVIATDANQTIDKDYFVKKPESGYDEKFGCFTIASGENGYEFATENSHILYSHVLTVVGLNGEVTRRDVRHGSTVYLYDDYSPVYTDNSKAFRLLYSTSSTEAGGTQVIMDGDLTVYALKRVAVDVVVHNGEEQIVISSFEGATVPLTVKNLQTITPPTYENGDTVKEGDKVPAGITAVHIYGAFVQTEKVVNFVKYTFSSQTMTYTAVGKAAGFNDYYSVKGNTLVLENSIGGYPVTAIAAGAFANTDGKPLVSVVVPENVVKVGQEAFKDNYGIKSVVFLAENVTLEGKDGSDGTMPFYGCSRSSEDTKIDGEKQNEITDLVVYYNNISASGGNWRHFKYVYNGWWFNFYIGDNGGAHYSKGQWQYVESNVSVELNGVSGSTLTEKAVNDILAGYFPRALAGTFEGSAYQAEVNTALEKALTQFNVKRGDVTFKCVFETELVTVGNKVTVNYKVSYAAACSINVLSPVAFTYYGEEVKANVLTEIPIPVEGENVNLENPVLDTHNFVKWNITETDGVKVYNAEWKAKEFALKVVLNRGGYDTSMVHIDSDNYKINGHGLPGKKTIDVATITIYGGEAKFEVKDNVLTIYTDGVTHTIYVNEIDWRGKEAGKRGISSDINGTVTVKGDLTLTLNY